MKKDFDLIIIGGGAAGITAAISAKKYHPEYSVAIVDRTFALGRKILVAGAGRCNVTNINLDKDLKGRYHGADIDFVQPVFNQFNFEQTVEFFKELGIELYVERKTNIGKLFPVTDQAKTVQMLLEDELQRLGVKIFLLHDCKGIKSKEKFEIEAQPIQNEKPSGDKVLFYSKYLILSAGGKTYPALGSNGSGYDLAQSLNHNIIQPVPSALPLVGKNLLSQEINGVKMEIEITSVINGKEIKTRTDDVMFTQYGLSGPATLNISREISIHLHREKGNNAKVLLNFFPGKNCEEVQELFQDRWTKRPEQSVELSLNGLFPPKFPPVFLKMLEINKDKKVQLLSQNEISSILNNLTQFEVQITDTRGWNEAEFTAGGVDTKEVENQTLQSKKIPNLYFCGEILDVDGDVGGFNLSWAWSSGFVAGKLL